MFGRGLQILWPKSVLEAVGFKSSVKILLSGSVGYEALMEFYSTSPNSLIRKIHKEWKKLELINDVMIEKQIRLFNLISKVLKMFCRKGKFNDEDIIILKDLDIYLKDFESFGAQDENFIGYVRSICNIILNFLDQHGMVEIYSLTTNQIEEVALKTRSLNFEGSAALLNIFQPYDIPLRVGIPNGIPNIISNKTLNKINTKDMWKLFDNVFDKEDDNDEDKILSCCQEISSGKMVRCSYGLCHWFHEKCAKITKLKTDFWYCMDHRSKPKSSQVKLRNVSGQIRL